jgi:hypothetical protein
MARMILTATVGTTPTPRYGTAKEPNAEATAQAALIAATKVATAAAKTQSTTTIAADIVAVTAAVVTLENDGISPTEAHVVALRSVYNTLVTDLGTLNTAVGAADTAAGLPSLTALTAAVSSDVSVLVNAATVLTKNKLKQIMSALVRSLTDSCDLLT